MDASNTKENESSRDDGGNVQLNVAVVQAFPPGCRVVEARVYGTAAWTRATLISVVLPDEEEPRRYFLKRASGELGRLMIEGEWNSMKELEKYMPALVPCPYKWGQFELDNVTTYFFLMEYKDIVTGAQDAAALCHQIAQLHRISSSPTGKFGFAVPTCQGPNVHNNEWQGNWRTYFTQVVDGFYHLDVKRNGPVDREYQEEYETLKNSTIPLILDPLQADGRVLKPCLVHGDLWDENTGTELATGQPVIFDAAVMYAHNEFELGMWRREGGKFGNAHLRQYLRSTPPSEPKHQWDDRLRLYSIKYELSHSIGNPDSCASQRAIILDVMRSLNDKYKQ